jgi:hypothetical protein
MPATDYDFIATRNEIIARAMRIVGALASGETLPADRLQQGVMILNHIVKGWQADRIFVWSLKRLDVPMVVGTASYSLHNLNVNVDKVLVVDRAALIDSTDIDVQVRQISWREYNIIEDKTSSGDPCAIAVDYQATPVMYVWPVPSRTGLTMALLAVTALKDEDTGASVGDIPVRFQEALVYALARDLADEYGLNLKERARYVQKAEFYYERLKRGDRERADMEFVKGAF